MGKVFSDHVHSAAEIMQIREEDPQISVLILISLQSSIRPATTVTHLITEFCIREGVAAHYIPQSFDEDVSFWTGVAWNKAMRRIVECYYLISEEWSIDKKSEEIAQLVKSIVHAMFEYLHSQVTENTLCAFFKRLYMQKQE